MKITLAKTAGFCFGVSRSVKLAEEMLAGGGKMILGSDSHTRYGALGTMAMGEGGPELVKQLLNKTYEEYLAKDVCYKLPIRANIYLMMTALLRYYCANKDESDRMVYHNVLRE